MFYKSLRIIVTVNKLFYDTMLNKEINEKRKAEGKIQNDGIPTQNWGANFNLSSFRNKYIWIFVYTNKILKVKNNIKLLHKF